MPPPTGVVSGPLIPTRYVRNASSVACGNHSPVWSNAFCPASTSCHAIWRRPPYALATAASNTRTLARQMSGPVPSPSMNGTHRPIRHHQFSSAPHNRFAARRHSLRSAFRFSSSVALADCDGARRGNGFTALGHVPMRRYEFFTETVENFVEKSHRTTRSTRLSAQHNGLHQSGATRRVERHIIPMRTRARMPRQGQHAVRRDARRVDVVRHRRLRASRGAGRY